MAEGVKMESAETFKVSVKHGAETVQVELPREGTISLLMDKLLPLTNIPPRGQKLIHKGKVLTASQSFKEAKLERNSKVMLVASQGMFQGAGPSTGPSRTQVERSKLASSSPGHQGRLSAPPPVALLQEKARQDFWVKTGVVTLRDSSLQVVPGAVWAVGGALRVLDLGGNTLRSFPAMSSILRGLQRLRLSNNVLTQASIAWEALTQLPHLSALALDHNQLSALPPAIGQLKKLKRLSLSHNVMSTLPSQLGELEKLEWLDVAHNRLSTIPATLSNCKLLGEVNYSANFVSFIPSSLGQLQHLKVLVLRNNALKTIPSEVLRGCAQLANLDFRGNPLTLEKFREIDGWEEFDERRRAKYNKQVDFSALASTTGFDEGGDAQPYSHW